jgi:CRISPR-associated endonuclease Csn1
MKKILGLDIGTNSIGGALISLPEKFEDFGKEGKIDYLGSRIIPMDTEMIMKFEKGLKIGTDEKGIAVSPTAKRRAKRGSRRLKQRYILRRTRLIKVFKILGWVNNDFPEDFKGLKRGNPGFKFKINDYLPFEQTTVEEATNLLGVKNKKGKLAISEDWIIYYLRKKAMTEKITMKELARIIYMLNQRRGFKSGRKDLKNIDEKIEERKWVEILTIESVIEEKNDDNVNNKSKDRKITFVVKAANSNHQWTVKRYKRPEWEGKIFTFLITENNGKISFKNPAADDWELVKVALNNDIKKSIQNGECKGIGEYMFNQLVNDKNYRIRQRVIDRELYQQELKAIWNEQSKHHPELIEISKLKQIAETLYPTQSKVNKVKYIEIISNDLLHVIMKDIIYYQRELKSQKNGIAECKYEKLIDKKNNIIYGIKVAPKSSPEFQEFRIWQDIHNIRIIQNEIEIKGKRKVDNDVTNMFINDNIKEKLFNLFDSSDKITEEKIYNKINELNSIEDLTTKTHKINLFANRNELKGNETKYVFRKVFRKFKYTEGENLLKDEIKFYHLWHILYSISSSDLDKSQKGIKTALKNIKFKFNIISNQVLDELTKIPEFKKEYAAFSSKAIKKLLPLMRMGSLWNCENIYSEAKKRIINIINAVFDKDIDDKLRDKIINYFKEIGIRLKDLKEENFQGLPIWLACYIVYGIHSERKSEEKYNRFEDINVMELLPNNSLRNPIVEQVIRETLHVVKDVWQRYGRPDEIHIELARDLKKNSEERKKLSENNNANFLEKQRIKKLLYELLNDEFEHYDINGEPIKSAFEVKPNPESPMDIEKFRIWKSCSGTDNEKLDEIFGKGNKQKIPTNEEVKKYTLWLSQKCMSPYTKKIIPLSKLFTKEYAIEHIIPRSKLKYDSPENLVICESAINPEPFKGDKLARTFIHEFSGKTLKINDNEYKILEENEYEIHCNTVFKNQRKKLKNLLREDIPNDFVTRQINDTRYISKKLSELLFPVAQEQNGIIFTSGGITSELKNEWGLNFLWKVLIKSRFERLEKITGAKYIDEYKDKNGELKINYNIPEVPDLNLKRIDHRHHALDALIIAATTREHIRYLNSLNAADTNEQLRNIKYKLVKGKIREFRLPWENFIEDAYEKIREVIVTFKSNNKVISKPLNKYFKWVQNNEGEWIKKLIKQQKPKDPEKNWVSVRRSMFKEPQGVIFIKEIKCKSVLDAIKVQIERNKGDKDESGKPRSYIYDKVIRNEIKALINKIGNNFIDLKKYIKKNPTYDKKGALIEKIRIAEFKEYAAKRVSIDKSFTFDKIDKIPYSVKSPLAILLRNHLNSYDGKSTEAFTGEGLEELNKKAGRNINKVTIYEDKNPADKFKGSYYETDKGGNVFFVISEDIKTGERNDMYSVPLLEAIERLANKEPIADSKTGYNTIVLSPNDLVYMPTDEEIETGKINWNDKNHICQRIYKMVSCTGSQCFFIPHTISKSIDNNCKELGANNKAEKAWDGYMIKKHCIKLNVDRLGNINPVLS